MMNDFCYHSRKFSLTDDIRASPFFIALMAEKEFCLELWAAMVDRSWYKKFIVDGSIDDQVTWVLSDDYKSSKQLIPWGAAANFIAMTRNINHDTSENWMTYFKPTPPGVVSDRVRTALLKLGWTTE